MTVIERGTDAYQAWVDAVVASKEAAQRDRDLALRALAQHQRAFDQIESAIHELEDADALDAIVGIINETRERSHGS